MKPFKTQGHQAENWDFAQSTSKKPNPMSKYTVKGSQFEMPYLEFSGACAGCGETPYLKLVTQLYGDRMMIANATGCSSIWGGSAPSTPFAVDSDGRGPAWANSLFEDNAEYGFGMHLAVEKMRSRIEELCLKVIDSDACENFKEKAQSWIDTRYDGEKTRETGSALLEILETYDKNCSIGKELADVINELLDLKEYFIKRSQWIVGGDGWAYDIGYGGLDHVLASGEDVNVLVFDTEVYSNTGGQASKSTPAGSVAKFAAAGKPIKKKDLGMMALSYGYVYVAQVAQGANQAHLLKAIKEAESYHGPSLVIAYAPCINHGIRAGMGCSQQQEKNAVEAGHWHLWRYNPLMADEGKNPFSLDSKEPTADFREFLMSENRYASLTRTFPERAERLFKQAEENSRERYEKYKKLSEGC
jgi:pyruvate-ferredoxin/flavodoxin oxidoreductase